MTLANRGRDLEVALDNQHRIYELQRLASVLDIPTRFKPIGRAGKTGGSLIVVPEHSGDPDYHVQSAGVSYLFDAKSTELPRWPLDKLTEDQAARFDRHVEQGGRAFVLLQFATVVVGQPARWLLPWLRFAGAESGLRDRWNAARAIRAGEGKKPLGWASVGVAECRAIGAPVRGFDWLSAASGSGWLDTSPGAM